jgi:hypothetical protein
VERGQIPVLPGSVAGQEHDVADALRGQVARLPGQVRPDAGADHPANQAGQRGLVTMPGADLEHLFGARQAQRRDDRGRQRRLGGHLMAGDGIEASS